MLTLKKSGKGKCVWCMREKEGVEVEFADHSLKGFLCWLHFRKSVEARTNEEAERKPAAARPNDEGSQP